MKKIISVALATLLVLSAVMTFPVVFADATANDIITNTFDEGWTPTDTNLALATPDGANGNALQFNAIANNANRYYKIYNPVKASGEYVDYKPLAKTTYKLTFSYRTRSLENNILINVRGVSGDTVGDVLARAVTVKNTLNLTDYKWDTAVAYITTPDSALDALAISVELSGATAVADFNVAIDDVKLEKAPSNFVLANTFEEDDVNVDTINLGTDTSTYKVSDYNANETGYNTSTITSKNSYTLRTNSTFGLRAARVLSNAKKAHFEIYDYSKGIGTDNKLQSFVPKKGATYTITFDYKIAKSNNNNLCINIREVTTNDGTRTVGDIIVTAVDIPTNDTKHTTTSKWMTASVEVPISADIEGLAIVVESKTNAASTYSFFDNVIVTEVKDECEHETTKDDVTTPATYFTTGLKNVVCADEACGAVVEENVVIERITADPITYTYSYNAKAAALSIDGKFSEALILDMLATNGAEFTLNYEVAGKTYKVENIAVAKEDVGVEIVINGFNKARLGQVEFDLEISWDGAVGTAYTDNAAEFNGKTNGKVDVTALITGEDKTAYDAFEEAIEAEDEKEIGTTADANNAFMNNSFKVNLAEGSAELKFSINDALRQTLKDNGGHEAAGRVVTFKLKIGENTYEEVIEELRVHMTVNITGLSFTHMNSEISAWLEVTYTDSAKNFSTADNSVVYNSTQIIENAATAGNGIAAAFKDLMN